MDNRLKAKIKFHDILHGFTKHRGTGTAIIEAKLQQELASILGVALYQVYLDLKKAYDKLDRTRLDQTLAGYGVGPLCRRLLRNYGFGQKIVPRKAGFCGPVIEASCGVVQGGLLSPMLFNIAIDAVVRHWLTLIPAQPTNVPTPASPDASPTPNTQPINK